jgi:hypothetical protein
VFVQGHLGDGTKDTRTSRTPAPAHLRHVGVEHTWLGKTSTRALVVFVSVVSDWTGWHTTTYRLDVYTQGR